MDDYRTPTPETVAAVCTRYRRRLRTVESGSAFVIGRAACAARPANLPSALWMPVPHRDILGSFWLPDIARRANPRAETHFRDRPRSGHPGAIATTAVVFYFPPIAGLAGRREAVSASGLTRVYWYPMALTWRHAKLPPGGTEPVRRAVTPLTG